MYKIKFIYKLFFYLLVGLLASAYFSLIIINAVSKSPITASKAIFDVSKTTLEQDVINAVSPFAGFSQTPPNTPNIPGKNNSEENTDDVEVLGVIPPDIVIMKKGNETLTAHKGETTWMGTVGNIFIDGAWINNNFIPLKKL